MCVILRLVASLVSVNPSHMYTVFVLYVWQPHFLWRNKEFLDLTVTVTDSVNQNHCHRVWSPQTAVHASEVPSSFHTSVTSWTPDCLRFWLRMKACCSATDCSRRRVSWLRRCDMAADWEATPSTVLFSFSISSDWRCSWDSDLHMTQKHQFFIHFFRMAPMLGFRPVQDTETSVFFIHFFRLAPLLGFGPACNRERFFFPSSSDRHSCWDLDLHLTQKHQFFPFLWSGALAGIWTCMRYRNISLFYPVFFFLTGAVAGIQTCTKHRNIFFPPISLDWCCSWDADQSELPRPSI